MALLFVNEARTYSKINKNIYGHFTEHLGNCIYGGIYVGEDSKIPNVRGIRSVTSVSRSSAGRAAASRNTITGWTASARRKTASAS